MSERLEIRIDTEFKQLLLTVAEKLSIPTDKLDEELQQKFCMVFMTSVNNFLSEAEVQRTIQNIIEQISNNES